MNIHFTSYFDVHQGYKVLTRCHIRTCCIIIVLITPLKLGWWGSQLGFVDTKWKSGGGSTKSQTWVKSDSAFSSFSTKSKPSTPFLSVLFSLLYQLSGSTGSKPWVGCSQIDDLQRKLQGVCINSHIAWYCIGSLVRKLQSYGRWSWLGFTSSCQPHHHMLTPSSCPPHHHQAISWDT